MQNIEWTEDLAIGNREIDSQHQELIKQINALQSAIAQGAEHTEVGKVIDFLEHYVLIHFNYEENQMLMREYPDFPAHREKHREFIRMFNELKEKLAQAGPRPALAAETLQNLFRWFTVHIKHMDRQFGTFLE